MLFLCLKSLYLFFYDFNTSEYLLREEYSILFFTLKSENIRVLSKDCRCFGFFAIERTHKANLLLLYFDLFTVTGDEVLTL